MTEFIDSEARHGRQSESMEFRDDRSSDSSDTDSSQCSLEFISKSKTDRRKRRLTFTDDESSGGKRRSRSRERKETRKRRDHVPHRHTRDRKVLKELQKSNNILLSLLDRVDKTEKRLRVVEQEISKVNTSVSSSDTTPSRSRKSRSKNDVPQEVRCETRRVYTLLIKEDIENFDGWKIEPGVTYNDPANQKVLSRLLGEVKALNPEFLTQQIKDAAYRFYRSRCEEQSAKRRGKLPEKNKCKRRHERIIRKYNERRSVAAKGQYKNTEEKEEFISALKMNLMSSDSSGDDDGEEVIVVHPLPWISSDMKSFKCKLDEQIKKERSPQARRQMKRRLTGTTSTRSCPTGLDVPTWALMEQ